MVIVAIAGGSSPTLGRSIVTALIENGKHQPVILSRVKSGPGSGSEPASTSKHNAAVRYVDYNSVDSLAEGLKDVHTVISVLNTTDPSQMIAFHNNLLQACVKAGCKRFAPSEWEGGPLNKKTVSFMSYKLDIWESCVKSGLECARFSCGAFMNYLGQGCPEKSRGEALAGLEDDFMIDYIDVARGKIVVPLRSDGLPAKTTMTALRDIGRFVAAAVDLDDGKWQPDMGMVGSTMTMQQVATHAEHITGRKFQATSITAAELQERQKQFDQELSKGFSLGAFMGKLVAQIVECGCYEQVGNQVIEPVLNTLCPQIKPIGVEEYLQRYWGSQS